MISLLAKYALESLPILVALTRIGIKRKHQKALAMHPNFGIKHFKAWEITVRKPKSHEVKIDLKTPLTSFCTYDLKKLICVLKNPKPLIKYIFSFSPLTSIYVGVKSHIATKFLESRINFRWITFPFLSQIFLHLFCGCDKVKTYSRS